MGMVYAAKFTAAATRGYSLGGRKPGADPYSKDCDEYEPNGNTWSAKADADQGWYAGAGVEFSPRIYCFGGWTEQQYLQSFLPVANAWATHGTLFTVGRSFPACSASATAIFSYGGYTAGGLLLNCDALTPGSGWTAKTNLPAPARYGSAASTISSKHYVYGGSDVADFTADCDEYNSSGNSWANKADLPSPARGYAAAVTIGTVGYVMGGSAAGGAGATKDCDAFTASTNTWANKADMPTPARSGSGAFVLSSIAYVLGGNSGLLADVDAYNPTTNTWDNSKADLPSPTRSDMVAATGNV